jgi:lipopolysaccharide/colanic/teichoic acid biosynthesis glycosyltransferase
MGQAHQYVGSTPRQLEWRVPLPRFQMMVKRGFDVLIANALLAIFAPLMLVIALAIKLDSRGPVLCRQERCSRHGKRFTMHKFRSMLSNAEDLKRHLKPHNEVDGPMFKIIRDPRITRVGKILRDSNLDELPQLWNVLKGDMSLVGPRPLSIDEMELNPKWRDSRLTMQPGMTGLWQVKAHSKLVFQDWLHYDTEYVNNFSLWFDVKIMAQTLLKMIPDFKASLGGRKELFR